MTTVLAGPPADLPIVLDRGAGASLATQIAGQARDAVTSGMLVAGERLPSTRELAATLGVSRTVVTTAYAQLFAEGWLEGRHGAGTFVADVAPPVSQDGQARDRRRTGGHGRAIGRIARDSRAGASGPASRTARPAARQPVGRGDRAGGMAAGLAAGGHAAARSLARSARPARVARRACPLPAPQPGPEHHARPGPGDPRRVQRPGRCRRGAGQAGRQSGRRGAGLSRRRGRCCTGPARKSCRAGWTSTGSCPRNCRAACGCCTRPPRTSTRSAAGCRCRGGRR